MGNLFGYENSSSVEIKGPFSFYDCHLIHVSGGPLVWRLYFQEFPNKCFWIESDENFLDYKGATIDFTSENHINHELRYVHSFIKTIKMKIYNDNLHRRSLYSRNFLL